METTQAEAVRKHVMDVRPSALGEHAERLFLRVGALKIRCADGYGFVFPDASCILTHGEHFDVIDSLFDTMEIARRLSEEVRFLRKHDR